LLRSVSRAYLSESKEHIVKKVEGVLLCDCGESVYQGYPCRHEMALCVCLLKDPKVLHFEPRWKKSFFNFEEDKSEEEKEGRNEKEKEKEEDKENEGEEQKEVENKVLLCLFVF